MQDEQDTCRICSAPAEPGAPLFHPCKCSGTIRYIHQDCLTTWLAHSKKKSCDVCKYHYSFTKVYSENMPKQLPFILFLRRFAQQTFWSFILCLRGVMVAIIWLAFLPYVTVWTWRFYFIVGENIAWWINDRPRPNTSPVFHPYYANVTVAEDVNGTTSPNMTIITLATSYPVWRALSSDIFTGQIIASLIVLAFLGVFLLREWIMQNARPGVFEEDDIHNEVDAQPAGGQAAPPPAAAAPAPDPVPIPAHETQAIIKVPNASPVGFNDIHLEVQERMQELNDSAFQNSEDIATSEDSDLAAPYGGRPRHRRKVQHRPERRDPRSSRYQRPMSADGDGSEDIKGKRRATNRLHRSRRIMSPMERSFEDIAAAGNTGETSPPSFQFTFAVERSPSPSHISNSFSDGQTSPSSFSFSPSPSSEHLFAYTKPDLPFPLTPSPSSDTSSSKINSSHSPFSATSPSDVNDGSAYNEPASSSYDATSESRARPSSSSTSSCYFPEETSGDPGPSTAETFDARKSLTPPPEAQDGEVPVLNLPNIDAYFRERTPAYSDDESEGVQDPMEDDLDGEIGGLPIGVPRAPPIVDPGENAQERNELPAPLGAQEVAEEQDANLDEDMDGALEEAIGMRGPITTVFQNAALMIFVLDTTIGVGIWLPFTIGKTSALLSLEPMRIVQLLHWPVRTIRLVTDPLVDFCFFVLRHVLYPLFRPFFQRTSAAIFFAFPSLGNIASPEVQKHAQQFLSSKVQTVLEVASSHQQVISSIFISSSDMDESLFTRSVNRFLDSPFMGVLEPYFARLGKHVRLNASFTKASWADLANGDGTANRFFAITVGYFVVGVVVALYLNLLNIGNVQSAGRAIRTAIRQQLIVTKVAAFILVELVIFPLGCGLMLDFCSVSLFPGITLAARGAFFLYAPLTAIFYHWLIGTMFMYQFAVLLAGCRQIMCPGALWFIKDPSDQNFHPIRDILDRPIFVQLRKLTISAFMYAVVISCGMGGIVFCCRLCLYPLKWRLREPLSTAPIDLLFFHIAMPATLRYFRPRRTIRAVATRYWRWAAHQLRLTSYMFGGRHPEEERPSEFSWQSFIKLLFGGKGTKVNERATFDGGFRRVPAGDNIALPKEVRATVAVDEFGSALDEAGQRLINLQNTEADRARRNATEDYRVVYLPPRFRYRVLLFMISLWIVSTILFVTAIALPLHVGRLVFKFSANREVHDLYSFIVGFYLLWGCFAMARTLDRMDKRRQRFGGDDPRAEWVVYIFKRAMLWSGKIIWMSFWLGFIIPTLVALVMEVYLIHPLRLIINPELTLRIRIVDSWMIGLIYTKLALASARFRPETSVDAAIKMIKRAGWRRPEAVQATRQIILPVTAGLLGMLFLPIALILGLQRLLPSTVNDKALFLYVYPGIFVLAAFLRAFEAVRSLGSTWAQAIRDSEFLVAMQLQNLEPPKPRLLEESPSSSTSNSLEVASSSSQGTNTISS